MKKVLPLVLALLVLGGCAMPELPRKDAAPSPTPSPAPTMSVASIKTVGDALALHSPENQSAAYENAFVYVFMLGGVYYRAIAPISPETAEAIWALEYDESYDARWRELVSPLVIEKIENLSALIPSQAELQALIGKTGAELLDDGWQSYGYKLDTMEFYLAKNPFRYTVVFEGEPEMSDPFDEYEAIGPLTVKSIVFDGLGDAAKLDIE